MPPQYQVAREVLPTHKERPIAVQNEPGNPEEIPDKEDTVDQASVGTVATPPQPPAQSVSRTTQWRQRKRAYESAGGEPAQAKAPRKEYTCRVCKQQMVGSGHTQFRGQRYCPNAPGQIAKEEWLRLRRAEAEAKKHAAKDS